MAEKDIDTPHGLARVVNLHPVAKPTASLLLTHGAGGGIEAMDLMSLAESLPQHGFDVQLLEMPWRVAGKKVAARPVVLDECFRAVFESLDIGGPVVIGGRSAGARVVCRLSDPLGVAGVLALAFPLHPPGRPESSRLAELEMATCPRLVLQGEQDTFGGPPEFPADPNLVPVPFANHSLKVPKRAPVTQEATLDLIVSAVLAWLQGSIVTG
ncbi:MAG: alpha/beta hydrolase family protein [Marmoricola sp.]